MTLDYIKAKEVHEVCIAVSDKCLTNLKLIAQLYEVKDDPFIQDNLIELLSHLSQSFQESIIIELSNLYGKDNYKAQISIYTLLKLVSALPTDTEDKLITELAELIPSLKKKKHNIQSALEGVKHTIADSNGIGSKIARIRASRSQLYAHRELISYKKIDIATEKDAYEVTLFSSKLLNIIGIHFFGNNPDNTFAALPQQLKFLFNYSNR